MPAIVKEEGGPSGYWTTVYLTCYVLACAVYTFLWIIPDFDSAWPDFDTTLNKHYTSLNKHYTSLNKYYTSLNKHYTSLNKYYTSLNKYYTSLDKHCYKMALCRVQYRTKRRGISAHRYTRYTRIGRFFSASLQILRGDSATLRATILPILHAAAANHSRMFCGRSLVAEQNFAHVCSGGSAGKK